jgi:RimJ/RimL family protein N-acetyltransferase
MLKGHRVILRALQREDLPRLCDFNNDLEVQLLAEFNPPRPQSLAREQTLFDEQVRTDRQGGVEFAIEAQGQFIGTCALGEVHPAHGTCGVNILIGDREHWGKGYGREAISLLIEYAFNMRNVRKLWLTTSATNKRALRCYGACGFVEEGRQRQQQWLNGKYVDEVYMGLLREEWLGSNQKQALSEEENRCQG